MERIIEIIANVNNDEHATLIREDVMNAVGRRTTLFYIGKVTDPKLPYSLITSQGKRKNYSHSIALILKERKYQKSKGYSSDHDDEHVDGELARAAAYYAMPGKNSKPPWPFDWSEAPPSSLTRIEELSKAGALIVAEIERLKRLQAQEITRDPEQDQVCRASSSDRPRGESMER